MKWTSLKKALFFIFFIGPIYSATVPSFVNEDLLTLLKVMEVKHDGTLPSIITATQKSWLRPAGKQRWEFQNSLTEDQKKAVMAFCIKKGFFSESKPLCKYYDYAFLLGATVSPMKSQMAYLAKLADQGVRFKQVVLLSGPRTLDPEVETIPEGCKTEGDAMLFLWKDQPLSKKVYWKHFQSPLMTTSQGNPRTPTRADTIKTWLASSPKAGRCFMISTSPYGFYQQLIAEETLPKGFKSETIGPAGDPSVQKPAVMLDMIARCLYMLGKCK